MFERDYQGTMLMFHLDARSALFGWKQWKCIREVSEGNRIDNLRRTFAVACRKSTAVDRIDFKDGVVNRTDKGK